MALVQVLIFITSSIFLSLSGKWLVDSLSSIAKFLGWKEFVVAFFLVAISVSIPNFFVGIVSALNKIPELSLGDVIGGNIIDLTLAPGISALISKMGLSAPSRTVQNSAIFLILISVFLLILISDGILSRADGLLLIFSFLGYIFWLFSKEERFKKTYSDNGEKIGLKIFFKKLGKFFLSTILLLVSAQGVVESAKFFGNYLNLNLGWVGLLIVAIGNALPETFFSIQSARKNQDWLILGNLIGSVVVSATLVLGTVSLLCPILVFDFSAILAGRIFLILSALFFFFALRTGHKITKKEAIFLLLTYFSFLLIEIFLKSL